MTGRRPVVEAAVATVAKRTDGLTVCRGVAVTGLVTAADSIAGVPTDSYLSEAYTAMNGNRLANALMTALPSNFATSGGGLHLIGHSHGSKVATVMCGGDVEGGSLVDEQWLLDLERAHLQVAAQNRKALALYQRWGFVQKEAIAVYSVPTT